MSRLTRDSAVLLIIDVQERFLPVIHNGADLQGNLDRLIRGTFVLGVPLILTEQYVKGLGPTVPPLRRALEETHGYHPIEKMCFSAAACAPFEEALRALGRRQVIVSGIETHVCVYQTVADLLQRGLEVTLVADALSSRAAENRDIALRRMTAEGAKLSSTEMVLFELLVTSGTEEFRAISRLVK